MMTRRFMMGGAFIAVILLDIWQHVHIVTMGYEVEQAQRKQKEMQQIHQQLLVEVETLSDLDRIERIAIMKLGMVQPQAGQVVLVEKGSPSGSSPEVMTRIQVAKKGP
jgi:cell division protein FtsL